MWGEGRESLAAHWHPCMCGTLNSVQSRTQLEIKECRNKTKIQAKTANIINLRITEVQDTEHIVNFPTCLDVYSSFTHTTQHAVQGQACDTSVPLNTSQICMVRLARTIMKFSVPHLCLISTSRNPTILYLYHFVMFVNC